MELNDACDICKNNHRKYRCPCCSTVTCSLTCCNKHKEINQCTGVRPKTVFTFKEKFDYTHFLSDYRLLEDIDRKSENRQRILIQGRFKKKYVKHRLIKYAEQEGIQLRCSTSIFLERVRKNRCRFLNSYSFKPVWTLEFVLFPYGEIDTDLIISEQTNWFHKLGKPIRIHLHNCEESDLIGDLWSKRVICKEKISVYDQPQEESLDFWISGDIFKNKSEPRYYFYIQLESCNLNYSSTSSISKCFTRKLVEPDFSIRNILSFCNHIIYEFPTIFVSRWLVN